MAQDEKTKNTDPYAIHEAAREGRLLVVESLLNANPKLANKADEDDRLPIHWATAYNHLDIIKLLLLSCPKYFDIDTPDSSGWTPLTIASSLRDNAGLDIINLFLSKEADPTIKTTSGGTPLHFAVSKNNLEVVRRLLQAGASARVKDKRGQLPLHRAAAVGNVPLVKLLVGEGKSPVNATDVDGMTALHHAVSEGHGDVAVELMKGGAEIDKRDKEDRLAVDLAPDAKVRNYIVREAERAGIDL